MRIALCGLGPWGRTLARTLGELGVLRRAIDPSPAALALAAPELGAVETSGAFGDALAGDVDAVVLATPIATHAALTLAALDAGKHVFCEKPLATSLADARAVQVRARAARRIVMVGHVMEYAPIVLAMRAHLASGALGRVLDVRAERSQPRRASRLADPLWELAVHDVGLLLRTLRRPVQSVSARADGTRVDLQLSLLGGARASLGADADAPDRVRRTRLSAERGVLMLDETEGTLLARAGGLEGLARPLAFATTPPLSRECEAFLAAIRTGAPPPTDVDMGFDVVRVLHAAATSIARGGAPIDLTGPPPRLAQA